MISHIEVLLLPLRLHESDDIAGDALKEEIMGDLSIVADSHSAVIEDLHMLLLASLDDKIALADHDLASGVLDAPRIALEDISDLCGSEILDDRGDLLHALAELRAKDLEVRLGAIGYDIALIRADVDILDIELLGDDRRVSQEDLPVPFAPVDDDKAGKRLTDLDVG